MDTTSPRGRAARGRLATSVSTLCAVGMLLGAPAPSTAQVAMPDIKQMSGIPRPVGDLPAGSVSVRLIRGALTNNITGHPVELHGGAKVLTAKTDDTGHALFSGLPPATPVHAVAIVDGERLESQQFPVPADGGVRVMLVAADKAAAGAPASTAPISGEVALGGQSRFVLEPGDETVQVYYLLDISNSARAPVNPASTFMFDMPTGAVGTTILEGSSPQASVNGPRVRVQGPFAPGQTLVQVACELPVSGDSVRLTQRFPVALPRLDVMVKKVGATRISSPQLTAQQEMTADRQAYIAATGGAVAAGQPIEIALSGLPHQSPVPRRIAQTLAVAILVLGVWGARNRGDEGARQNERRRLVARRDKLFADLVRLETDHRSGRGDRTRYATRREELMASLEQVYGALDDDAGPEPGDRAGLAA